MKKKAISAVVSTILIVLLAVVAVVIVWAVLKPMIIQSAEKISSNCLEVDLSIDSVNCTEKQVTITLNAGEISNISIAMTNGTDSASEIVAAPNTLETKTYTLTGEEGEDLDLDSPTSVKAAARIKLTDGSEKICENYVSKNC